MKYFLVCIMILVTHWCSAQTLEATLVVGESEASVLIDKQKWKNERLIEVLEPSAFNLSALDYAIVENVRYVPVEPSRIHEFQMSEQTELVFLEVLMTGTIGLYQIKSEERFFVSKEDRYYELIRSPNANGILQDVFKHTLHTLLQDCHAITADQIGKLGLTETKLKPLIREYNAECGFQTYTQRNLQISIGPLLGYGWSVYDLKDADRNLNPFFAEFSFSGAFHNQHKILGGILNLHNPFKQRGVSFNTSLFYQRIDGTNNSTIVPLAILPDEVNVHNDEIHMDLLCIDIGPCLHLKGEALSYTLGIGLRSSYRVKTEAKLSVTRVAHQIPLYTREQVLDDSEYSKFSNALVLDMAIGYKRSFLELSYTAGINEYFNIPLEDSKGVAVSIGYYLN